MLHDAVAAEDELTVQTRVALGWNVARVVGMLALAAVLYVLAAEASGVGSTWGDRIARGAGLGHQAVSNGSVLGAATVFFTVLGAGALAAALALDPRRGALRRLGVRRGELTRPTLLACVIGTLFLDYTGTLAVQAFERPDGDLLAFQRLFATEAGGPELTVLFVLVLSTGAALAEELLFRGLLLRHLAAWTPPTVAIGIVAVAFAVAHGTGQHALGIAPVGLWLTVLAWRSGSLVPPVLAHLVNNAVAAGFIAWCGVRIEYGLPAWVHVLAWGVALPALVLGARGLRG